MLFTKTLYHSITITTTICFQNLIGLQLICICFHYVKKKHIIHKLLYSKIQLSFTNWEIITHFKIVNCVISLRLTRGIPLDMSIIQCNCTILIFEKKCYFTFKKLCSTQCVFASICYINKQSHVML